MDVFYHLASNVAFKKRMEMEFVCLIGMEAMNVFAITTVDHFAMNVITNLTVDHFI